MDHAATVHALGAVGLRGSRLQKHRGGVSVSHTAPLQTPPLHPQLLPDLLHLRLQLSLLRLQTLFLGLAEASVSSSVEPKKRFTGNKTDVN